MRNPHQTTTQIKTLQGNISKQVASCEDFILLAHINHLVTDICNDAKIIDLVEDEEAKAVAFEDESLKRLLRERIGLLSPSQKVYVFAFVQGLLENKEQRKNEAGNKTRSKKRTASDVQ